MIAGAEALVFDCGMSTKEVSAMTVEEVIQWFNAAYRKRKQQAERAQRGW